MNVCFLAVDGHKQKIRVNFTAIPIFCLKNNHKKNLICYSDHFFLMEQLTMGHEAFSSIEFI